MKCSRAVPLMALWLVAALVLLPSCPAKEDNGNGPGSDICIDASYCPKSCQQDSECKTDEGQLCCDYKNFGKSCRDSQRCPIFCSTQNECDTAEG